MINISEAAQAKIRELLKEAENPMKGIRLVATAVSPLKIDYNLGFVPEEEDTSADKVLSFEGFEVYFSPEIEQYVEGITLNVRETLQGGGFSIENAPKLTPELKGPVAEKLQKLIDEQINPALKLHGGFVSLIDVDEPRAYIELGGGCKGCGMVDVTLKQGIEVMIKQAVPEISEILDVTDHASGSNPYYTPSK